MRLPGIGRPSPALVVACVALFVALGGTGYAALKLPKNSVGSKQIKKRAVRNAKIARNAVTGTKVRQGSLTASDFKASSLPSGPAGPAGPQGPPGSAGQLPKVGSAVLSAADFTINGGPAELARFTTTAPASGVLVVTLEGNAWLDYDAANASAVTDSGTLGLCDATASLDAARCGQTIKVFSQDADNASNTNATDQFSMTRVIPVTAGATTLYLNAEESSAGEFGVEAPPSVTAIWMPDTGTLPITEGP